MGGVSANQEKKVTEIEMTASHQSYSQDSEITENEDETDLKTDENTLSETKAPSDHDERMKRPPPSGRDWGNEHRNQPLIRPLLLVTSS